MCAYLLLFSTAKIERRRDTYFANVCPNSRSPFKLALPLLSANNQTTRTHREHAGFRFCKMHKWIPKDVYGGETREKYWQDFGKGWIKIYWTKNAEAGKDLRFEMRAEKIKKIRANFLLHNGIQCVSFEFVFCPDARKSSSKVCLLLQTLPKDNTAKIDNAHNCLADGESAVRGHIYAIECTDNQFRAVL